MNTDKRFLNYKKYDNFQQDLTNRNIPEDAIVFIQDKLRIWARGKEYLCGELKDSLTINGNTITIKDKDGNIIATNKFALVSDLNYAVSQLTAKVNTKANLNVLGDYATKAYVENEVKKLRPAPLDTTINKESSNAVINSAIADALELKADISQLHNYIILDIIVTLSASAYRTLVDAGAVQSNVYYFIYEDEEETTNWTFGGTFPIIFSQGDGIGTFPITLT